MRGIEIPPEDEDFTADPVELFFDLAYVFAFSRLVYHLVHDPTWSGVGEFALVFGLIWLVWSNFTWAANAVAGNQRPVRIVFLVGTVASVPMAAAATTAFDSGSIVFAVSLAIINLLGPALVFSSLPPDHPVRRSIVRYAVPNAVAGGLIIVGSLFEQSVLTVWWLVAIVVVMVGMVRAGDDTWLVRPGHFAERHGLITIIALGEVIVALSIPVVASLEEDGSIAPATWAAIVAAGVFACLMWWSYFDRVNPAIEHGHHQQHDAHTLGRYARDVYSVWHAPVVAGIILAAAALEEITLHPDEPLPLAFRVMLLGGMGLYALGVIGAVWRSFRVVAHERILASSLIAILVATGSGLDGLVVLILVDVLLAVALAAEHVRVERPVATSSSVR